MSMSVYFIVLETEEETTVASRVARIALIIVAVTAASIGSFYAAIYVWNRHITRLSLTDKATVESPSSKARSNQILSYLRQGHYDDAIDTDLKALHNSPTDAAIYQELALICLIRAEKEKSDPEQRLTEGVTYLDKALAVDSNDPVNLLQTADSFLHAGDVSRSERCKYYIRARETAQQAAPAYSGNQITIAGKAYPVDSTRKEFAAAGRTFRIEMLEKQRDSLLAILKTRLAASACQ
jgi:tetratricopeptide (TPR) repeat protein